MYCFLPLPTRTQWLGSHHQVKARWLEVVLAQAGVVMGMEYLPCRGREKLPDSYLEFVVP